MELKPYFHLSFRPNIKLVSTVRRFTADFYRRVLVDQELASRLALATHEMLENAVAYATDGETSLRIEIDHDRLSIKTWNRTTDESAAALQTLIDEMNATTDADEFYQRMLVKTAKRTDGSGLGLARVRAEAEMDVGYEIDKDRVCIMATAPVTGGMLQ